jgi:tetratricopeptide (TPR) repeat protein
MESGHAGSSPYGAFNVGVMLTEQGDLAGAIAAYRFAVDSDHPDITPRAAVNLGVLLEEQGDLDGARTLYQQAIDFDHVDMSPLAASKLGTLLVNLGDRAGAERAYRVAMESGDSECAPWAAYSLGHMLIESRPWHWKRAREALQVAIDSGRPDHSEMARGMLAVLLAKQFNRVPPTSWRGRWSPRDIPRRPP